jgi:hypothetical protein
MGDRKEIDSGKDTGAIKAVKQRTPSASRARQPIGRFIEHSLREAYAATLREEIPSRFTQLLDRLKASQGGGDGDAR